MKYSIEKLVHFQCEENGCKKWFSIGDAPLDMRYFCPWCGAQSSRLSKADNLLHEAANELKPLAGYVAQLSAWQEKGERLLNNSGFNAAFSLGYWWADRPWRKRA